MKKLIAFLVLIPFVLLLAKCTTVHFEHDFASHKLLVNLRRLPLPRDSRLLYEQAEVGSFIAATGDATDILAYRIFITDLPAQEVADFFTPIIKQQNVEFDLGICRIDTPPNGPYLPIDSILKHVPQAERSRAYLLYSTARCTEDGLWDMRGW